MRAAPGRAFHVACPHTGAAICYCSYGVPATMSTSASSQLYYHQAHILWETWKTASGLFRKERGLDVMIPALYRREMTQGDEDNVPEVLPSCVDSEKAVKSARKAAGEAAHKAAKLAASAGLKYKPMKEVQVEQRSPKRQCRGDKGPVALHAEISKLEDEITKIREERNLLDNERASKEEKLKQKIQEAEKKLAETDRLKNKGQSVAGHAHPIEKINQEQASATGTQTGSQPAYQPPEAAKGHIEKSNSHSGKQLSGWPLNLSSDTAQPDMLTKSPQNSSLKVPQVGPSQPVHDSKGKLKRLKAADISTDLQGRSLWVFWPEDHKWWTVLVQSIDLKEKTAVLLYETNEIEQVNLMELIQCGEVAFPEEATSHRASWGSGAVLEAPYGQAVKSQMSNSHAAAMHKPRMISQQSCPSPPPTPSPLARGIDLAQQNHQTAGHAVQSPLSVAEQPPRSIGLRGAAGSWRGGMIGQAGERRPLSVSDVLQLGSVVIGRRVEVMLRKERVWMKGHVLAMNHRQGNMIVQLDIGPKMTLTANGQELVRVL